MRAVTVALLCALLAAAGSAGCWKTVYHFDAAQTQPSPMYQGRWRTSLVAGIIEVQAPVSMEKGCPGGTPALIVEQTSPANALLGLLVNALVLEFPLVHFRSVTMDCGPPAPVPVRP